MKLKQLLLLVLVVFIHADIIAQKLPKELKGIDKLVEEVLKDWQVPGVGIGIVKDGEVILAKGYGYRDVDGKKKVDENTLFAIGSSSKAFTAASVAMAVDDGLIDFDEPVKTYLPNLKMYDEYTTENITVRDMLSHRSGLPRHDLVWYGSDKSRKDLFNALEYLEPTAKLRNTWQYQNLMYMTAGYLVGQKSGKTWEEYVQERIFEPLGMNASNFSVNDSQKSDNYALGYKINSDEKVEKMDFRNIDAIGPAGSINSNANDMCKWMLLHLNGGKVGETELISTNNFKEMHYPQMVMPSGKSEDVYYTTYGLGWMLTSYRGHPRSQHGGNIDGFSANVGFLPDDNIGVVVLTNMNGTQATSIIRNSIFDRLLGLDEIDWNEKLKEGRDKAKEAAKDVKADESDPMRKKDTKPSHDLVDYVGKYSHPAYGNFEVKLENDKLMIYSRYKEAELKHYHFDVFKAKNDGIINDTKFRFHMNNDGDIINASATLQLGVDEIVFEKEIETGEVNLELYTGEYELAGQQITVFIENDILKLNVPPQPIYELELKKKHVYGIKGADGFTLIFDVQDEKPAGKVTFDQPNGTFTATRKK
jgi:CubicO group peptidase (beta-lactamase class C family)